MHRFAKPGDESPAGSNPVLSVEFDNWALVCIIVCVRMAIYDV